MERPNETTAQTPAIAITVDGHREKPISSDLFGVFLEDLNYAADGGLYAELIQNRSFEYSPADHRDWNFLTGWELIQSAGGRCSLEWASAEPIHPNNPHYLLLNILTPGDTGLRNFGFDGIPVRAGEDYDVSIFARSFGGGIGAFSARLETRTGEILGETSLLAPSEGWAKQTATIRCHADERDARFVLQISGTGTVALDMISLFPRKTFHGRPNGLRPDLAQAIADLKPRFVRFPGGCLAHGDGLDNMYRWKDTIGPVETRRAQPNLWGYHQTVGLGYFEYFQFCEDIGAKPLPVVPAGVCCQNTGARFTGRWGQGQCGLPLDEMPAYIQEVLDLIEWANGPVTSKWGAKRAEAGHPEPFGLEYLGVGNEDNITPVFRERFQMIYDAVRVKHPEITVIGTVGPFHAGEDFDEGWKIARELALPMVDEHYYVTPDWFWDNLTRYDRYDRSESKIYLGEYAAHEPDRKCTLRAALSEAACMTALERNGDVVAMASYAPLLAKRGHTQWNPDLIYFDNSRLTPTISYFVQQLFGENAGDTLLETDVAISGEAISSLAVSCVRDSAAGDIVLKIASRADISRTASIRLEGIGSLSPDATCTILTGSPSDENAFGAEPKVAPQASSIKVGPVFDYEIPAHSLSVIRLKA